MVRRFFISDHHLWHENIIYYCGRPFKNVWEMGEALLTYHNEIVKPQDHVSFLGDVTTLRGGRVQREQFIKEIRKYNGHKRLYLGNHDHFPIKVYLDAGFEKIYATWRDEGRILFSHIPIHPQSMSTAIANVHGHTHQAANFPHVLQIHPKNGGVMVKPYVNVSCEVINYRPIEYEELKARIDSQVKAAS